ncbi:aminodeoxychorismate synthase component I [Desulfogranum japonicum]|uniref:aminodeoxychorismate synthase component I n=1 Tax=Desulfogranum japonicum TaxID=231447 RepID=UPI0004192AF1|nr:aminodeoxychorismate synthase component I [Desulfogranum japonicum]
MKVLLRFDKKWLQFEQPEKLLVTDRVDKVTGLLHQAEASKLWVAGFISYEAAPAFDDALVTRQPEGFPLLCLGLYRSPVVIRATLPEPDGGFSLGEKRTSVTRDEYERAIDQIKRQIARGATYQVNYTYRINREFSGDPYSFFCALIKKQPSEYAAYIATEDFAICSISPELFFTLENDLVTLKPMKGTIGRGRTNREDLEMVGRLKQSIKDRAENIMIVDMIRNDIGRVALPGGVTTVSLFDVEKYPTVHQMTSTVTGRVCAKGDQDKGQGRVCTILQGLFPCASITGAPKVDTMEIIRDLESTPRKVYTGAIGLITPTGDCCWNVAIRTALIENNMLEYGVGGGIVWDSRTQSEWVETLVKAKVLEGNYREFELLETILWEPGSGYFLLKKHLARLKYSAEYFSVPLNMPEIEQALEEMEERLKDSPHRVRLLVSRQGELKLEIYPQDISSSGECSCALAKEPVDSTDIFLFHKTTNRTVYGERKAPFPDVDEVILYNERGEVTEGCISNIVVKRGGKLVTPPTPCGLLAGTFRDHLIEEGTVAEEVICVEELAEVEEIYCINSVRKWRRAAITMD